MKPPFNTQIRSAVRLGPGVFLSAVIALASLAIAERYDAPVMLFALLIGMALSHLNTDAKLQPGLAFAASDMLKAGVAVLGLTISIHTFASIGITAVVLIIALMVLTMITGLIMGRFLGWGLPKSAIAAGAVAICGASAALAISSVVDPTKRNNSHVLAVILVTTGMSTLSMIFYPVLLGQIHMDVVGTGFVLGASIHDVAQVIGAGFSVSDEVGQAATLTKMVRVAMLPVILLVLSMTVGRRETGARGKIHLPYFVLVFAGLFCLASVIDIPQTLLDGAKTLSRVLFYVAVAAIGLNSKVQDITKAGHSTVIVIASCSAVLFIGSLIVSFTLV